VQQYFEASSETLEAVFDRNGSVSASRCQRRGDALVDFQRVETAAPPAIPVHTGIKLVWSAQADLYGAIRLLKTLEEAIGMHSSTTFQNHLTGHF
jgi:hypothetical protein